MSPTQKVSITRWSVQPALTPPAGPAPPISRPSATLPWAPGRPTPAAVHHTDRAWTAPRARPLPPKTRKKAASLAVLGLLHRTSGQQHIAASGPHHAARGDHPRRRTAGVTTRARIFPAYPFRALIFAHQRTHEMQRGQILTDNFDGRHDRDSEERTNNPP